ncbi:hypothetical protein [Micromonospora carbonacea]|uniref:DUF5666 domain-containing protein n=1 Tax=Micromonospora carbonacea TaxID=47853 RepID=A0A7H8XJY9_9ACTN|nr:hypothetical protein [Micromonospora carbonacea]MBB5826769.1 preprotein translocase subunit YajC [Micromonospora carbonacea]QLD25367.1 hypothetical protein HXZ27_15075 [Micromonospora carbonacea]
MDNSDTVVFARVGGAATDPTGPAEPDDDRAPASPAAAGPDGDLTAALAAAAPRRWWNRGTLVLGALVLVVAGFLGGVQVQQRWGEPAGGSARAGAFPGGLPGGAAGPGRGQGGTGPGGQPGVAASAAAGSATGTVTLVDGDTLYVETADGTVVTVRTTDGTAVRTTRASKLTAIKRGQTVTVQGGALTDNAMTASSVTAGD